MSGGGTGDPRRWRLALCSFGLAASLAAGGSPENSGLTILQTTVPPGFLERLALRFGDSYAGDKLAAPVLVAHGRAPGPTVCLTAAIHGDELNGIEVVRRVFAGLEPEQLSGTVIGVPVVNLPGFANGTRETPDRRDLNRYIPGRPDGSFADRIADRLYQGLIVPHCDRLIDFHTGSFNRANLPQLRANLHDPQVREFARMFGATPVLQKRGGRHMLRRVATEAGIPSVTFELGTSATVQADLVVYAERVVTAALVGLDMLPGTPPAGESQPVYGDPRWVRTPQGGIFMSRKALGATVKAGERIGVIANPLTEEAIQITAPISGRILGMASNQAVLPGYGVFHLGVPQRGDTVAPVPIAWTEAERLLLSGQVASTQPAAQGRACLTLQDGRTVCSVEPARNYLIEFVAAHGLSGKVLVASE